MVRRSGLSTAPTRDFAINNGLIVELAVSVSIAPICATDPTRFGSAVPPLPSSNEKLNSVAVLVIAALASTVPAIEQTTSAYAMLVPVAVRAGSGLVNVNRTPPVIAAKLPASTVPAPFLNVALLQLRPAENRSSNCTLLAGAPPTFSTITRKVMVSPASTFATLACSATTGEA